MKSFTKTLRTASITLLTLGVITAIGLLSYCGMLVIIPSIPLAWIAFALAGLVEGEVFKQNITHGVDSLKLLGKKGLSQLIIKSLDEKLEKEPQGDSPLRDYYLQKKYIASFEHKKLTKAQKEEKAAAEKRLRRMQKYLVAVILSPNYNQDETLKNNATIRAIRNEIPTLKRKRRMVWMSIPFCILGGIGFGFATASALDIALLGLGLSASLAPLIWPLAIVACVGYTFLIYRTISDIICNDTFSKWRKQIKIWFEKKKEGDKTESNLRYGLRVFGLGLLIAVTVGLGILATLATAGTWWLAVKEGASLLPFLRGSASIIRSILVPIAGLTILAFTIGNSLQSIQQIIKAIKHAKPFTYLKDKMADLKKEPRWQRYNPFRILAYLISTPFKWIVFIGHLIATGLTGDRTPGLNKSATIASAVVGAASDGLVDYHYVTQDHSEHEEKEHAHGHKHKHQHEQHAHHHEHAHKHEHGHPEHEHGGDDHDDHHHHLLMDVFLKTLLSPLYFMAAVWDFVGAKSSTSFYQLLLKHFDIKPDEPYAAEKAPHPVSTSAWIKKEIALRFQKHRLAAKTANEEKVLVTYQDYLVKKQDDPTFKIPPLTVAAKIISKQGASPRCAGSDPLLSKPHGLFHHTAPRKKTVVWVNKMIRAYG